MATLQLREEAFIWVLVALGEAFTLFLLLVVVLVEGRASLKLKLVATPCLTPECWGYSDEPLHWAKPSLLRPQQTLCTGTGSLYR